MKFESKKDWLFSLITLGTIALIIAVTVWGLLNDELQAEEYWSLPVLAASIGFLAWLYFGTSYEITDDEFIYRSGPFRGRMKATRITEIIKGKTLWVGFRPATSRHGLIIKYDKCDELYISPKTNESFIQKILELNDKIIITEK